ncbi:MAG: hypothetical protein ABF752_08220 [Acetobacter fabarum]|uniref:hypothetical protein n=1 Tax=Acetobacter fabarum TaxID=483199 RepID=UPI0039EA06EF
MQLAFHAPKLFWMVGGGVGALDTDESACATKEIPEKTIIEESSNFLFTLSRLK